VMKKLITPVRDTYYVRFHPGFIEERGCRYIIPTLRNHILNIQKEVK